MRDGWVDLVGLGRMVLSYPELLWHASEGHEIQRKLICRTFSDCTAAPRNPLPSGRYPLDHHEIFMELFYCEKATIARVSWIQRGDIQG